MFHHTLLRRLQCSHHHILSTAKSFHVIATEPSTEFLKVNDSKSGRTREIPYKKLEGFRNHGVLYIPGFMASKSGTKATALHSFCSEYGFPYVRYDPAGLGESRSMSLKDARLTHWIQDAREILLRLTEGPQIIVASSMGAWVCLSLALKHPDKFSSLVLIAPAFNITQRYFDKIIPDLPEAARERLMQGGSINLTLPDYGTFPISYDLAESMFQSELDISKGLDITCPVRIIHGTKDPDVPYEASIDMMKVLHSSDILLTLVKDGDHNLGKEENLQLLFDTILKLDAAKAKSS